MQTTAALRDIHFKSLEGCAAGIKCSSDFPIPQDDGYDVLETMEECMLSWEQKFLVMLSSRYATVVGGALPPAGWATKKIAGGHHQGTQLVSWQCSGSVLMHLQE